MARYIVVRVESNESAEKLLEKFKAVPAIQTIGLFASPTKFCPGKAVCGQERRLVRSKKWGTLHCRVCKLPINTLNQEPRNLLLDEDLHPRFVDFRISVREPYAPPETVYGVEAIERKKAQVANGAMRIKRHRQRKRRQRAAEED